MTRHDTDAGNFPPAADRWNDSVPQNRATPSYDLMTTGQGSEGAVTWPSAVFPAQAYQHSAGLLTLNALLASDLPRPALPAWTQAPNRFHIWPAVASAAWAGLGFWAHTEPLHALMAAGFCVAGTVASGLGAFGVAVGNVVARDAESEPPDKAGTRGLLGAGLAAFAGAASTGAGFSGIGCMLAAGTVAAGYGGYFGWQRHNRHQAIQSVIAFAAASNPGPMPPGMPLPPIQLPGPTNLFESRIQGMLEPMRITGTWLGSPRQVAKDAWSIPFELPAGANMSPESLAKKEAVLANNIRARRVEVDPTAGPRGVFTIYDGPDRTDETFAWDGAMMTGADDRILIALDEAGRFVEIDLTEHLLLTGKTQMGKSALLRQILCSTLAAPIVRIGVDCKDGAPGLGMFEPVMHRLATDPMDGLRIQFGVKAIAAARGKLMRERGLEQWDLTLGPRVLVAVDERAELTRRFPQAAKILQSNLQLVLASKITYVDCTQTPSGPVFGSNTDARHQYGVRIGFRNDSEANRMLFGTTAVGKGWRVEDLDGKGKFLISSLAHTRPRKNKALWVPREEAVELIEEYRNRIHQLDDMSAEAFEAGMEAFDEAMAAGLDPLEVFEPPPTPTGGGRMPDPIEAAQDFVADRPLLWIVPKYPDGEPIEAKHRAMWDMLGSYGDAGALAMELAAKRLDGFTSDSNVRNVLRFWVERGYVAAEKDGRADRFTRVDRVGRGNRKEA